MKYSKSLAANKSHLKKITPLYRFYLENPKIRRTKKMRPKKFNTLHILRRNGVLDEFWNEPLLKRPSNRKSPRKKVLIYKKKGNYGEYLKSSHWKQLKAEYKRSPFYNYSCFHCGAKKLLNFHHRNYDRIGEEKYSDIIVLCHYCHKKIHGITNLEKPKTDKKSMIKNEILLLGDKYESIIKSKNKKELDKLMPIPIIQSFK